MGPHRGDSEDRQQAGGGCAAQPLQHRPAIRRESPAHSPPGRTRRPTPRASSPSTRVQPGQMSVSRTVTLPMTGQSWMSMPTSSATVTVEAGKTAQVSIGGTGRPVVGRLNLPKEVTDRSRLDLLDVHAHDQGRLPQARDARRREGIGADAAAEVARRVHEVRRGQGVPGGDGQSAAGPPPVTRWSASPTAHSAPTTSRPALPDLDRDLESEPRRHLRPGRHLATASADVTVPDMPGGRSDEPLEVPTLEMKIQQHRRRRRRAPRVRRQDARRQGR